MSNSSKRHYRLPALLFTVICSLTPLCRPGAAAAGSGKLANSPYPLTPGATKSPNTSSAASFLSPVLDVQFFVTGNTPDASGALSDNPRFGAGLDLPHGYPGKADIFGGTDFLNELSESLAIIYNSRNIRVTKTMLVSVDWGKLGMVYATPERFKAALYYYVSDPGSDNISGFEGEVSYPVGNSLRVGLTGRGDLSKRSDFDRDWKGFAFMTYAFDSQKILQ